ncbi:IS3 family transposase [Methylomonas rosea]|uniref:IS3 family transposase n=1 Tax=Methylomonas rosea TaxID=2952227 RepID=A0ABT1TY41_9GAMM|nr:IS3 family transposase [Methylomonas sp. WSC-7]
MAYQKLLDKHLLLCRISKMIVICTDNTAMESWSHSLGVEAIHDECFLTPTNAEQHLFDYIEVYYNPEQLHSKLGYMSPEAFEFKHVA